jgi:hypothetical protein
MSVEICSNLEMRSEFFVSLFLSLARAVDATLAVALNNSHQLQKSSRVGNRLRSAIIVVQAGSRGSPRVAKARIIRRHRPENSRHYVSARLADTVRLAFDFTRGKFELSEVPSRLPSNGR